MAGPSTYTTITVAGTASAQVGRAIRAYSIFTDGTNAATLTVTKVTDTATSGTLIWKDKVLGANFGKTVVFGDLTPLGPTTTVKSTATTSGGADFCYVTIAGTGAEAYIQSE